ncbi:hypothetical protein AB4Z29_08705 [Paenibacillus sp. 2TAB23]
MFDGNWRWLTGSKGETELPATSRIWNTILKLDAMRQVLEAK